MKKSIFIVIYNILVDAVFMLYSRELYFLAFLLPFLNIILIAVFLKECSSLHKTLLSLALLVALSVIQLGIMKIIGDNGDFALTVILTFFLTVLPLFVASIVFYLIKKIH